MTSAKGFNRLCQIEDFASPRIVSSIRDLHPDILLTQPTFPAGHEHRKAWEYAQLMLGVNDLAVLHPDALVLSVAAGHERPLFEFTKRSRLVFATDIYGTSEFSGREAATNMLVDPESFAAFPFNRNRLVVQYMNALDLRHENDTFDLVFCLSSIEHFGGYEGAKRSLEEMHRVCKPGGIVMITTECVVNGKVPPRIYNLELFTPRLLELLCTSVPGLELVEPIDFHLSDATRATVQNLDQALEELERGVCRYPHVVLEIAGCDFTSVSLFLRKSCA